MCVCVCVYILNITNRLQPSLRYKLDQERRGSFLPRLIRIFYIRFITPTLIIIITKYLENLIIPFHKVLPNKLFHCSDCIFDFLFGIKILCCTDLLIQILTY
jgi:hypothetical protein